MSKLAIYVPTVQPISRINLTDVLPITFSKLHAKFELYLLPVSKFVFSSVHLLSLSIFLWGDCSMSMILKGRVMLYSEPKYITDMCCLVHLLTYLLRKLL